MNLSHDVASPRQRQESEISLLQAMYPDYVQWNATRQELTYRTDHGTLLLRLPDNYPGTSGPTLVSASGYGKRDVRDLMKVRIAGLNVPADEEALDAVVQVFDEVTASIEEEENNTAENKKAPAGEKEAQIAPCRTVIIWLHHLLNTNKRKLALSPTLGLNGIAGITKPGYPGVLLYSGVAQVIDTHVAELRSQRWQAFQIRLDEIGPAPWSFVHQAGIVEVESMAEVVQRIVRPDQKEAFMKCIGVK